MKRLTHLKLDLMDFTSSLVYKTQIFLHLTVKAKFYCFVPLLFEKSSAKTVATLLCNENNITIIWRKVAVF